MKQIFSIGILVISTAQAVELGPIAVSSSQGQPFKASIPIVLAPDQSLENVSAAIVATEPSVADLTLVLSDSPKPAIRLSSKEAVSLEQFDLTVQIDDPAENNEYHYELTLPVVTAAKPFTYGPVKQGDTLWHVASQFAKHYKLSPEQATEELYKQNPKAFSKGNKDQLMAGSYLKLPGSMAKSSTKQKVVKFEPIEVVTQPRVAEAAQIPEFPEMVEGKQLAINFSNALSGFLNPLKDADTALFSNTLQSVIGAEGASVSTAIENLQNELQMARDAIELERDAKLTLQSQVEDLEIQLRAVTELISLQDAGESLSSITSSFQLPSFSLDEMQYQILLIVAAIGIASLLMYTWEHMRGRKKALAQEQRFEASSASQQKPGRAASTIPDDVYEGDPPSDPVQTKLDLARAYIDIGDKISAREILMEVVQEGTSSQKMSAEVLMSQID